MFVIGMTGNAGCGKSYVCRCISELLYCPVIDSDTVCRELMMPGQKVYEDVANEFGPEYLCEDGTLNRAAIAEKVFNDPEALLKLNSLTHPATIEEIKRRIAAYKEEGYGFVIVESALAEDAGYREFCDELWLVAAKKENRIARLRDRGYSDEKIASVMASQKQQEELDMTKYRWVDNNRENDRFLLYHQCMHHLDTALGRSVWRKMIGKVSVAD